MLMSRELLGITDRNTWIDHKDLNPLNNRRENLRISTPGQNAANVRTHKDKVSSRYKGVGKNGARFIARIRIDDALKNLGSFSSEEDAARTYDDAARKYFGEFARFNFPKPHERSALE